MSGTQTVTQDQLDACMRAYDENSDPYYLVCSSRNDCLYTVKAILINGRWVIVCNCKAGMCGTPCWHKRAAIEAARLYKISFAKYEAELEEERRVRRLASMGLTLMEAQIALSEAPQESDETLVLLYGPSVARPTEAQMNEDAKRNECYTRFK